jgi:hypothetical protein
MALDLRYCFSQRCDCKVAVFNDESGVYSFSNTGGYGAPNIDPLTITSATMTIYPFGYVNPIVFTFTIASGIITAATKTDEYGIVTNVFSLLNTVLFPFVDLEMGSALLYGDSGDSVLADGSWRLIYSITDGTSVYELEAYNYFVCSAKKCKDNTSIDAAAGKITQASAIRVFFNYDLLMAGVGLKNNTFVDEQVLVMGDLCNTCNNCNC